MAEAIGTAVARVSRGETASLAQSTDSWATVDLTILATLPDRLDDQLLAAVSHIAELTPPPVVPASHDHFLRCLRTLRTLPTRPDADDLSGELRLALYRKHFGSYSTEALSFLVEHATLECRFFPTPSECKAILDRWNRSDGPWRAHQLARARVSREVNARFDELMLRFSEGQVTQEEADRLPERWKRIAAVRGYLREDGTYALRPVRRWGQEQEGRSPAGLYEQHTGAGENDGKRHAEQ